ncbi:Uncharacterised protein [Mycoplasmopsis maculosa]|uniref:Uncharacterized protein n=1 Tax=Mycoplasmopsis maculosa TaxID=114885 RepID=A0A449B578_9BACT|nr:hypothetical protein [Mycoplasmopsis maculosa]VEU75750.1 Uncharacterised protein [Mycoplasmopsis maculosa]
MKRLSLATMILNIIFISFVLMYFVIIFPALLISSLPSNFYGGNNTEKEIENIYRLVLFSNSSIFLFWFVFVPLKLAVLILNFILMVKTRENETTLILFILSILISTILAIVASAILYNNFKKEELAKNAIQQ